VWCSLHREACDCFECDALNLDDRHGERLARWDHDWTATRGRQPATAAASSANDPPAVDGDGTRSLDGCALDGAFPGSRLRAWVSRARRGGRVPRVRRCGGRLHPPRPRGPVIDGLPNGALGPGGPVVLSPEHDRHPWKAPQPSGAARSAQAPRSDATGPAWPPRGVAKPRRAGDCLSLREAKPPRRQVSPERHLEAPTAHRGPGHPPASRACGAGAGRAEPQGGGAARGSAPPLKPRGSAA
jgi:hypothetical protein